MTDRIAARLENVRRLTHVILLEPPSDSPLFAPHSEVLSQPALFD